MANCPSSALLAKSQEFDSLWQLSKQIGNGGQGEIFITHPTELNTKYYSSIYDNNRGSLRSRHHIINRDEENTKFVTKIMSLDKFGHDGRRERIINNYLFVHKHKLLNIYGIYHDEISNELLIVMQYLSHELGEHCFVDNVDSFNSRFSRPGYIYLNSELCLKLFIKQITKQLDIIHSNNRIHFDLKPQNIMFNAQENKWCIIDYDLMKCIETNSNINEGEGGVVTDGDNQDITMKVDHFRGTKSWTSPEMGVDAKRERPNIISPKTDVFSLGLIILFIVKWGNQPYLLLDEDIEDVHCKELVESSRWRRRKVYYDKLMRNGKGNQYLQGYLDSLNLDRDISDDLCKLLSNMLQFDVNKRFNCKQILNDPWLSNIP